MYRGRSIAVVVPAHNELAHIARALAAVPSFVDLVFAVDDASVDGTRDQVLRVAIHDGRIRLLEHERNRGVGAAIVTGYRAALRAGADIVVVMDGDGQMDPRDLAALLDPVVSGRAGFAKGYRFAGLRARGPMPVDRLVGNHVLSALTRRAAAHPGPLDSQCGYTALSAAALMRIPIDDLYPRYGFPNDLVLKAVAAGVSIESVPVRAVYRNEVSGIRPVVAVPRIVALLCGAYVRRVLAPPVRALRAAFQASDQR